MNEKKSKYGKYIVTELNQDVIEAPWAPKGLGAISPGKTGRVLWLDNQTVPGAFYVETVWIFPRKVSPHGGTQSHTHNYDEVLAFFGTNPDDPYDLGGEAEFYIDDEKHVITRSCLVFVPAGLKHSPLRFNRVDRPIFHYSIGPGKMYF
jgi:mannose-6-phosphate isomerase-like protein (cupin superfamily)